VKGVTKLEQAERANGVHTEVSVGRQGPPPVGELVFHGRNLRGVRSPLGWVGHTQTGAYDAFPGLGHVERVTFSTRGSCPGAPLALVGVHTEVFRTERLRLSSDRVRRSLSTGFVVPELRCPRSGSFRSSGSEVVTVQPGL